MHYIGTRNINVIISGRGPLETYPRKFTVSSIMSAQLVLSQKSLSHRASLLHNVLHDFLFVQSPDNESEIWPWVCRGDNYEQNEIPLPPKNAPSKVGINY